MNLPNDKRDQLAADLHRRRCDMGHKEWSGCSDGLGRGCEDVADALAPLLADWLTEARTQALRDAAEGFEAYQRDIARRTASVRPWVHACDWLRDRADRIEAGE